MGFGDVGFTQQDCMHVINIFETHSLICVDFAQVRFGSENTEAWHWLHSLSICPMMKILVNRVSDQDLLVIQGFTGEGLLLL